MRLRQSVILFFLSLCLTSLPAFSQTTASSTLTPDFLREPESKQPAPVEIPEPITGMGRLSITIESFGGENPKRISQLADRVELWLGDKRLASLNHDFDEVVSERNRRVFYFPEIEMPAGYYFITVRLYSPGALHGRQKSHEQTFQVGIHPEKTSRVYKKMPFFHW